MNLAIWVGLGVSWVALSPGEVEADFSPSNASRLGALEERVANDPSDVEALRSLTTSYLVFRRPDAALSTLRAADPRVLAHPELGDNLAVAYEAMGRFDEALGVATLNQERCARSIGGYGGSLGTLTTYTSYGCPMRDYARISVHEIALRRIVEWGVVRANDPRVARAYEMAARPARIAPAG